VAEKVKDIFSFLKRKPQCVLCEKEIEEDQMICDVCWEQEKEEWK